MGPPRRFVRCKLYFYKTEITDLTQVRWLAGLNHTNGLHYAPYTLPFSFPKPHSHNLTRPAILIRRLKHPT